MPITEISKRAGKMDKFESARSEFRTLEKMVYLNWAGIGPAPKSSVDAVSSYMEYLYDMSRKENAFTIMEIADEVKAELAKLLNADSSEIAITGTSTSQGIQTAFEAINPEKGENIVTGNLQYVLTEAELQKWRSRGVSIRVVKNENGTFDINAFEKNIDDNTRAVFLDSVTWINGYRFNIPEIAKVAHEKGALMITDSIQHIGEVSLDTKKFGADIIVSGAQKWLSDWLGLGFMYVRKGLIGELDRPYYGYKNTSEPEGGWPAYFTKFDREEFPDYEFNNSDATKFEYGGSLYNMGGLVALRPALRLINGIGIESIEDRILTLKEQLIIGLEEMELNVLPPYDEVNKSGITTFSLGHGRDEDMKVVEKLNSSGFALSYRAGGGIGGIRASIHYVNNEDDIDKFLSAIREIKTSL